MEAIAFVTIGNNVLDITVKNTENYNQIKRLVNREKLQN